LNFIDKNRFVLLKITKLWIYTTQIGYKLEGFKLQVKDYSRPIGLNGVLKGILDRFADFVKNREIYFL